MRRKTVNGHVELMDMTPAPVELISQAMGTCYGKADTSINRVRRAYTAQHMSVFEHAKFTVRLKNVSRVLTHQLVRHRMASYCQESQRYVKLDTTGDDWYQIPETIRNSKYLWPYVEAMRKCAHEYQHLLDAGIPAEDARYVLPNATRSNMVVTMNLREFFAVLTLRDDPHAQKEIRDVVCEIRDVLCEADPQWGWLLELPHMDD